jgi:hypothetical protein
MEFLLYLTHKLIISRKRLKECVPLWAGEESGKILVISATNNGMNATYYGKSTTNLIRSATNYGECNK